MNTNNLDDEKEYKYPGYYERYMPRLFKILIYVVLFWNIVFIFWLLKNFNKIDKLQVFSYFKCFVHTTLRKKNFMTILDNDCNYSNNISYKNLVKNIRI